MEFITATTTANLATAIGAVSSGMFSSVETWIYIAVGIPLAFYIVKRILGLLPKGR